MPLLLQIEICGSRQAALFGAADRCRRGSVIAVFSVADLNKNEMFFVRHDEVNLSHAAQEVACDQLESLRSQIIKRILLGAPSCLPAAHFPGGSTSCCEAGVESKCRYDNGAIAYCV